MSGDTVSLESVGLQYDDGPNVLRDVSLAIPQGSFHFLTGPSGAGKTSLLSLMYLAKRPTRGRVQLFGEDTTAARRARLAAMRRRLGVVFQDFRLLDHMSAFDNVALPLRVAGIAEPVVQRDVTELMKWVGLEDDMAKHPAVLSGGQQQRVAIARAVVNRPKLILADEPTGNVDDAIALRLMMLFVEMHKLGSSIIIATHNQGLVTRFPFPRLHLDDGEITVLPAASCNTRGGGVNMFALRSDLPLRGDSASRFVAWLVMVLVFIAAFAVTVGAYVGVLLEDWNRGVSGTLTVQIPLDAGSKPTLDARRRQGARRAQASSGGGARAAAAARQGR